MTYRIFTRVLALVMAAALMLSLAGCSGSADEENLARIAELEQENEDLRAQIEDLTAQLDALRAPVALAGWTLEAAPWSDGNGATLTFTATPETYLEGQSVALSIRMGDLEAEGATCSWNGTCYEGALELSAADGYSYYCVITNPDGSPSEMALATPENGQRQDLVDLAAHLASYANLILEDWTATAAELKVNSGFAQVQTPRMTVGNAAITVSSANLVLGLDSQEVSRQALQLPEGEGEGAYELALSNIAFTLPEMGEDSQLDLWLEVVLSTGQTLTVSGGSWYHNGGELLMVVG